MNTLPAQTWLILRNDLRLLWREFRGRKWRVFGSIAALGIVLGLAHTLTIWLFSHAGTPPPLRIEAIIWAFLAFIMLGSAMNHAIGLLFERADFDLLLASPISPRAVLFARITSIATSAALSVGLFALPLLNGAIFGFGPRYLAGYALWLALTALATTAGVAAALGLVRLLGVRRARVSVQVLAAVLGVSMYLAFQLPHLFPRGGRQTSLQALAALTDHPLFTLPARAARGEPWALLAFVVLGGVAFVVTGRQLARTFLAGLQDAAGLPAKRRAAQGRTRGWAEGLAAATFRKDVRLILRDPLLIAQVLPSALYFIPALAGVGRNVGVGVLAPLAVVAAGQFSALFTTICASGEECWDLIRMSPSPELRLRLAKMAAGMVLPLAVALALCGVLAGLGRPGVALLGFATAAAVGAGASWLQVTSIQPTPRKDVLKSRSGRSLGRGIATSALLLVGALGTGFFANGNHLAGLVVTGVAWLGVLACFVLVDLQPLRLDPLEGPAAPEAPAAGAPAAGGSR